MAIKYKIAELRIPDSTPEDERVQTPIAVTGIIDPNTFLEKLKQYSHMGKTDLVRCLYALRELLTNELLDGNIVQTGFIGTFRPFIKKSKKKLSQGNMEVSIQYRPALDMKKEMKNAEFVEVQGKTKTNK